MQICMKNLFAEKNVFDKFTALLLSQFSTTVHIDLWVVVVHTRLNQLLLDISVYSFDTWQVCYRHIVDVLEGV